MYVLALLLHLVDGDMADVSLKFIKTRLGDQKNADLTPERAAEAVLDRAHKAGLEDSGRFVDIEVPGFERPDGRRKYTGSDLPW